MKWKKLYLYLWYLILDGYQRAVRANFVEDNIPGRYVSEHRLPEHTINEILTITCLSLTGNVYEVSHEVEQIIEQGSVQTITSLRRERWVGFYDGRLRQLVETNMDKFVFFLPEQLKALYGTKELNKTMLPA